MTQIAHFGSRRITDGFHWIMNCTNSNLARRKAKGQEWYRDGLSLHGCRNAFLFQGDETLLFETLSPMARELILEELDVLLDGRELDYLVISHTDTPHCGNAQAILREYPECSLIAPTVGQPDELYYLATAGGAEKGDEIELGQFTIEFCEAYFMDAPKSIWAYENTTEALLTSDWLSFSHHEGECLQFVDEMSWELTVDNLEIFHERVFFWLEYVELSDAFDVIDEIIRKIDPSIICPPHGSVIREDALSYLEKMKTVTERLAGRSPARGLQ